MADIPVAPPTPVVPTAAPNRNTTTDPLVYSQVADAWAGSIPAYNAYLASLGTNVQFNAESAYDSATEAEASATAAASIIDAVEWVSGTTYALGFAVWSPIDLLTYRRKIAGAGTTDPSADAVNWVLVTLIEPSTKDYQAFTASGTWTKPTGANFVLVELWSGGAGGANNTAGASNAGGGSGGEYIRAIFRASDLAATVSVTVGAGGAGGANASDIAGAAGGNTTFGAHLEAIGGNPGLATNFLATIPRSATASISNATTSISIFKNTGGYDRAGYGGEPNGPGGNSVYGGGGGGGRSSSANGGTSEYGGNGGSGNDTLDTKAGDGTAPAGGGGGSSNNGGGGDGARGEARIWTW